MSYWCCYKYFTMSVCYRHGLAFSAWVLSYSQELRGELSFLM
uniref:Uncharacterized protein n=1 Tax=Anguilla anguilla TaxID=7936 RepID=A0A0E9WNE2_ANGAN